MPSRTCYLHTKAEVEALVCEIRKAYRKSRQTGGGYSVFRKHPDTQEYTLHIECVARAPQ